MLSFLPFRAKPRQFNYKPIYFDPDKDAREERKKQVLGIDAYRRLNPDGTEKEYIPGEFIRELKIRRGVVSNKDRVSKMRTSAIRMLILIALAGILVFFIFR